MAQLAPSVNDLDQSGSHFWPLAVYGDGTSGPGMISPVAGQDRQLNGLALRKLKRDVPSVADHFRADLDQLLAQRGQPPAFYLLPYGRLLLWVTTGSR